MDDPTSAAKKQSKVTVAAKKALTATVTRGVRLSLEALDRVLDVGSTLLLLGFLGALLNFSYRSNPADPSSTTLKWWLTDPFTYRLLLWLGVPITVIAYIRRPHATPVWIVAVRMLGIFTLLMAALWLIVPWISLPQTEPVKELVRKMSEADTVAVGAQTARAVGFHNALPYLLVDVALVLLGVMCVGVAKVGRVRHEFEEAQPRAGAEGDPRPRGQRRSWACIWYDGTRLVPRGFLIAYFVPMTLGCWIGLSEAFNVIWTRATSSEYEAKVIETQATGLRDELKAILDQSKVPGNQIGTLLGRVDTLFGNVALSEKQAEQWRLAQSTLMTFQKNRTKAPESHTDTLKWRGDSTALIVKMRQQAINAPKSVTSPTATARRWNLLFLPLGVLIAYLLLWPSEPEEPFDEPAAT